VLALHAIVLGAAEATGNLISDPFREGALEQWGDDFAKGSQANADAAAPVSGLVLRRGVAA